MHPQRRLHRGALRAEQRDVTLRRQIARHRQRRPARCRRPRLRRSTASRTNSAAIEYVALGPAQAGDIAAPTPEVLAQVFRGAQGRCSARRNTARSRCSSLTPAELAPSRIEVSDADAKKAYYEQRKARYGTPERRAAQADRVPERGGGRGRRATSSPRARRFDGARQRARAQGQRHRSRHGRQGRVIDRGGRRRRLRAQGRRGQRAGRRAASARCSSRSARSSRRRSKPFEEVAAEIKREIADRARQERAQQRAATRSRTSAPAARRSPRPRKKLNLKPRDDRGDRPHRPRCPTASRSPTCRRASTCCRAAFASRCRRRERAAAAAGRRLSSGSTSTGITPSRERTLDEVKDQVVARWRDDEIAERLKAKADRDARQAQGRHAVRRTSPRPTSSRSRWRPGIKRGAAAGRLLPAQPSAEIFRTPKDAAGSVEGDKPTERIVFRVTEVKVPPLDPESADAKRIDDALQRALRRRPDRRNISRGCESDIGVTINQSALQPGHRRRQRSN